MSSGGGGGGGGCVETGEIYEKGGGNGGSLGNVQGIENWADSGMAAPDNSQQTDTSTDVDIDDKRHVNNVSPLILLQVLLSYDPFFLSVFQVMTADGCSFGLSPDQLGYTKCINFHGEL